jgi:HD-GYP domain-containing protein (c-di-GMP phosphodiesterase class II)
MVDFYIHAEPTHCNKDFNEYVKIFTSSLDLTSDEALDYLLQIYLNTDISNSLLDDVIGSMLQRHFASKKYLDQDSIKKIEDLISRDKFVSRREAELLFGINNNVDDKSKHPAWQKLFLESITDHLTNIKSSDSSGYIDEDEAKWLIRQIEFDGSYDSIELALLFHLEEIGLVSKNLRPTIDTVCDSLIEQSTAYMEVIQALVNALDAKDPYTANHSRRVTEISLNLAHYIGLDEQMIQKLEYGAIMHDLGKIGVPDLVLNKPSKLTNDEFNVIASHPSNTRKILAPLKSLKDYMEIACWHHERWDGKGYPDGLKGEEIPIMARIVSIADTWDAMIGDRIYRVGMPIKKALSILIKEKDMGQWDPQLIRKFITMTEAEIENGC